MTEIWVAIGCAAVVSMLIKAAGPALLGERELPARLIGVIALLAAALLAGLVVVDTRSEFSWPLLAGLATVAVSRWRGAPELVAILLGVVVTALLRLPGTLG
jgi:branched-subunit amino acid transport protein